MDLDDILLEMLDGFIDGGKVNIEEYCKKYPEYREAIVSKFKTAEFIKKNFHEEDLSGKQLGEYIILQELGRGGMGVVFLGIQPSLSRLSAIKILSPSFSQDHEALKNFQEEAKTIAKFNHPNIVPIYSISDEKGMRYIAMGYVSGQSLKNVIETLKTKKNPDKLKASSIREILQAPLAKSHDISQKSITLKRPAKFWDKSYFQFVATIGAEIADALSYAHQNGIIHGDLKPANILLTCETIPMVADFGLSRNIRELISSKKEEFAGTLIYASPEQIKENILNEHTDIWSLGATLYELLTLKNPFSDKTIKKTADKILRGNLVPLRTHNKKIPVELEAIVLKCLELNPKARYDSLSGLSGDLNNYLKSKPIKAKPIGLFKRIGKFIRRRPLVSFLTFVLISSMIASSFLFFKNKISDAINEGVSYYNQGDNDSALRTYSGALELVKLIPFSEYRQKEIFCDIADALANKGEYEKAIAYYKNALNLDPSYPQAILGLATTYFESGNYDEAIRYCRLGIKSSANNRDYYFYLGKSLAGKGSFDEAIETYLKEIKLASGDAETLGEIVAVLNQKNLSSDTDISEYLKRRGFSNKQIQAVISIHSKPKSV